MSMKRSQVIEQICADLSQASAAQLSAIYTLLRPEDPIIAADSEHFEHQDMVD